ncbi:Phr family secreted Rap phosphatase inhibitor [Bacillus mycoides]|uniref:Phr family secreted Rap phosphatase inhibitor n=1 Tax=Bacillus mycoides TaxID=1405 RepID=UPI001C5FAD9E|nr:Phr family secreted Rap phosphatase inhibitor [Bacillus mycoides]
MKKLKVLLLGIALTGTLAFGINLIQHHEDSNVSQEKVVDYVLYMNRGDTW